MDKMTLDHYNHCTQLTYINNHTNSYKLNSTRRRYFFTPEPRSLQHNHLITDMFQSVYYITYQIQDTRVVSEITEVYIQHIISNRL